MMNNNSKSRATGKNKQKGWYKYVKKKKKSNKRNTGILISQLAKLHEKESTNVNIDVNNKLGSLLQLTNNQRNAA